jgi:hypothetical protein
VRLFAGTPAASSAEQLAPVSLGDRRIRSMSGGPSGGGGSVRLRAGSLIAMTRSSKPPGVQMNSMRQPAAPTV